MFLQHFRCFIAYLHLYVLPQVPADFMSYTCCFLPFSPAWDVSHATIHHELQVRLAPWKKSCNKSRQHIKKQRHHFAAKGPFSQSYGFFSSQVWMWELDHKEGWVLKNWCFQIVVLGLLRVPWTVKRSNQSILKEINPEYSLEGLMLKLKLQ